MFGSAPRPSRSSTVPPSSPDIGGAAKATKCWCWITTWMLVRDRGSQFVDAFDEVVRSEGFKILPTPVRTPVANAFAERWIGSIRRGLLDRTIIWNQRQLERIVVDYTAHYNQHRPHQSLAQQPPTPFHDPPVATPATVTVLRTSRCDGLIHEYRNAA